MNRSNGNSRAASSKTAAVSASSKSKSDEDGVIVSFDSDNDSSSGDDDDADGSSEGRSSSSSSAKAESSEEEPSSQGEEASDDEEKGKDDAEKMADKKVNGSDEISYKLTLEPSTTDTAAAKEAQKKDSDADEEEDKGDSTEGEKEKTEDEDQEDQETGTEDEENQVDGNEGKEEKDDQQESEQSDDGDEPQKTVIDKVDKKNEADHDDVPSVSDSLSVNKKLGKNVGLLETSDKKDDDVDISSVKLVDEVALQQKPSTTSADLKSNSAATAANSDKQITHDQEANSTTANIPNANVDNEAVQEETKKKKKKAKKKPSDDAETVDHDSIEGEKKSCGDTDGKTNQSVSGSVINSLMSKPDLLPNDDHLQPSKTEQVRSADNSDHITILNAASNAESRIDSVASKSEAHLTSSVHISTENQLSDVVDPKHIDAPPDKPVSEKKKKRGTSTKSAASATENGDTPSVEDVDQRTTVKADYSTTEAAVDLSKPSKQADCDKLTISVSPAAAEADVTEVATATVTQPQDDVSAVKALEGEEEKEGKKKKKKKKSANQTSEDGTVKADIDADGKPAASDRVNEESDFTYRRKSIDDFIRRILAEAREEQKKRMDDLQQSTAPDQTTSLQSGSATDQATEAQQLQPSLAAAATKRDEIPNVNGVAVTSTSVISSIADSQSSDGILSTAPSMLDRRLASTDRKREMENGAKSPSELMNGTSASTAAIKSTSLFSDRSRTDDDSALPDLGRKATAVRNGISTSGEVEDIDKELADIGQYFAKRTPINIDTATADDNDMGTSDVSGWLKVRPSKVGSQLDGIGTTVTDGNDDLNGGFEHLLSGGRRFSAQFGLVGTEDFIPSRRPETDEIIRDHLRPVRGLIESQADVIQRLKSVGRDVVQLDDEIREVRQRCIIERRSAVQSILAAVAEEMRLSDAEQKAADERIARQLAVIHFVREQFVVAAMSPAVNSSRIRSGSGVDQSFVPPSWMTSTVGSRTSSNFDLPPLPTSSRRAQSVAPAGGGESFDINRKLRGGSVSRDSNYASNTNDINGDESTSVRKWTTSSTQRSTITDNGDITDSGRRNRVQRAGSVGPSWYSSTSLTQQRYDNGDYSDFGSRSGLTTTTQPAFDAYSSSDDVGSSSGRRYSSYRSSYDYTTDVPSSSDRRYSSGYSSYSSSDDSSSNPSSRYTRRYSIADASTPRYSDRYSSRGSYGDYPTYGSGGSSSYSYSSRTSGGGGEFQSKFLDKVRERKAKAAAGGDSSSGSTADKPFTSRFLKTTFDSEPSKHFSSTSSSYD